jgi:hypothetical protein
MMVKTASMKPIFLALVTSSLPISLYACDVVESSTAEQEQPGMNLQGMNLQGMNLQGMNLQGMNLQGFQFGGATLGPASLKKLRVDRGELVAERGHVTLRGTALAGAQLKAQVYDPSVGPSTTLPVTYRIAAVAPESAQHDPTKTGSTFLYTLEQWVGEGGSWQPACPPDHEGRRVAIPLAAIWDHRGARVESSSLFTFGCTAGVIAKCYRWGYRPWVTGYGDLATMHWTCTRLARADYCGDGVSHTKDGTLINVWDNLPAPGPIQKRAQVPGMLFEAGWNTAGAVCLSHTRWATVESLIAYECADRLVPPAEGGIACDGPGEAKQYYPTALMFNESYINH